MKEKPMTKSVREDYEGREMAIGKRTEGIVMPWLAGRFERVEDIRDNIAWRQLDADVICFHSEGASGTAEIKTCNRIGVTGTIFLEALRLYYKADPYDCASPGWGFGSQATSGIWYCPPTNSIYVALLDDLRRAAQHYCEVGGDTVVLRPAIHPNPEFEPGKKPRKTTWGLVIPNEYLHGGIVKSYKLYPRPEKR
jgi:hypothetical protein